MLLTSYAYYIHIFSLNIILLLFMFCSIGYILNEKSDKKILTKKLKLYFTILLIVALSSDLWIVFENPFWLSFPIFQFKLILILILITLSKISLRIIALNQNAFSILFFLLFLLLYSTTIFIESKSYV